MQIVSMLENLGVEIAFAEAGAWSTLLSRPLTGAGEES
jgi:hypothetical protein